jgi:hypothetical protein
MKKLRDIIFIAVVCCSILCLLFEKIVCKEQVSSNCEYKLPQKYSIVQDTISKKYAIEVETALGKTYLYKPLLGYTFIYGEIDEAEVFDDSCEAKLFAKEYFKSRQPKRVFTKVK